MQGNGHERGTVLDNSSPFSIREERIQKTGPYFVRERQRTKFSSLHDCLSVRVMSNQMEICVGACKIYLKRTS